MLLTKGYERRDPYYFRNFTTGQFWTGYERCKSEGARMLSLKTPQEYDFLLSLGIDRHAWICK